MMQSCTRFLSVQDKSRYQGFSRVCTLFCLLALMAIGGGLAGAAATDQADAAILAKCKADLTQRLTLKDQEITVVDAQATTWPNSALGMPEIGKMYAQALTPGWKIVLEARNTRYLYTASNKAFRYGGPVALWSQSMLYMMPTPNEPNLNGTLYQCSLLGTNSVRLVSGVADYYPQAEGMLIIKRRTSRSSHELLLVNAADPSKERTLHTALDFGAAAVTPTQDAWAGFVRPGLGSAWTVVVARLDEEHAPLQTLPLPDGVGTGRIAWSGETLMILVTKGERTACYACTPSADAPEWRAVNIYAFPGQDLMLNKSETLEIIQATANGKPAVEVARVWFTGDRNIIATISGLTLQGFDILATGHAIIWGESEGRPAACTVRLATGEIIRSARGIGQNIKPFAYAPISQP